jgi:hypothetical protein
VSPQRSWSEWRPWARRDFALVASVLRDQNSPPELAEAMADALEGTYSRFDRARFLRAAIRPQPGRLKVVEGGLSPSLLW